MNSRHTFFLYQGLDDGLPQHTSQPKVSHEGGVWTKTFFNQRTNQRHGRQSSTFWCYVCLWQARNLQIDVFFHHSFAWNRQSLYPPFAESTSAPTMTPFVCHHLLSGFTVRSFSWSLPCSSLQAQRFLLNLEVKSPWALLSPERCFPSGQSLHMLDRSKVSSRNDAK
jgi:hypothetical protein